MTAHALKQEPISGVWTADQFLEFAITRPNEERWQLVDGLAMMMVPPSFQHQRIVSNLESLLKEALRASRPELFPFANVGLRVPGIDDFHPQPDIAICPASLAREYFANQFFMIAEVMSPSNKTEMIERKMDLYRRHPDNLYCLTIFQDSVGVIAEARETNWQPTELHALTDTLKLPAFLFETKLAEIYEGTPLASQPSRAGSVRENQG